MNLIKGERAYGGIGGSQERNEICKNSNLLMHVNYFAVLNLNFSSGVNDV